MYVCNSFIELQCHSVQHTLLQEIEHFNLEVFSSVLAGLVRQAGVPKKTSGVETFNLMTKYGCMYVLR